MTKHAIITLLILILFPFYCLSQTLVELPSWMVWPLGNEGVTIYGTGTTENPYSAYDTDMLTVTKLTVGGGTTLNGIEYLANLDSIEISGAALTSLSPLSNLVKLQKIKVYNSNLSAVTDFSFLNSLSMLVYVQFHNCNISEINNMSLSNTNPIDMEFGYNALDNDDLQSFYNVPNFRYLDIYGSNIGIIQVFSAEAVSQLMATKPGLSVRYRGADYRSFQISANEYGTKYYITFTDLDTLGTDHYFLKYDVKYGMLYFPEGAELIKSDYTWHLTPAKGIVVADENGKRRELGYGGIKLRSDIGGLLTPDRLIPSSVSLYGFNAAVGSVTQSGSQYFTFPDFPYPFSEIIDYYMDMAEKNQTAIPDKIRGGIYYNKNADDPTYVFSMQLVQFDLPTFTLKDVLIRYDGLNDQMEGSVKLSTGYGRFEFDADVIFSRGKLDKLVLSMGTEFPLGWTGLNVTSIGGGVEDFSSENWKVVATAGLESVLSYPYIGPLFSSEEMALKVAPFSQFEATGNFSVFGAEVATGMVKYINSKNCLTVQGNVNFGDILVGSLRSSLTPYRYSGIINGVIKTPSELPWKFKYLQNKTIASIIAKLDNNVISCETDFFGIPLAQKMTFNTPDFPYFSYELGENLHSLTRVLKSTNSESYNVPDNTAQILMVAGNDLSLFHISAISPSNKTFNKTNAIYQQYEDTKQTVLIIRDPEPGVWKITAETEGDYKLEVLGADPVPAIIFDTITTNEQTDKLLQFRVLNAPENYRLHLCQDDDRSGFDGYRLTSFSYRNINDHLFSIDMNEHLSHSQLSNLNIYVELYDEMEKNLVHTAYALTTYDGVYAQEKPLEAPQNFLAEIASDSVKLSWDETTDNNANFVAIYCKKATDIDFTEMILINDTNTVSLTDLQINAHYEIFSRFLKSNVAPGPESERLSIYLPGPGTTENIPPYFITTADDEWVFFTDSLNEFTFEANDPDGDALQFSLFENPDGVILEGNKLVWNPTTTQVFDHYVTVTVTDGQEGDTLRKLLKVYEKEYISPSIWLSSYSVIENRTITVEVKDFNTGTDQISVTLTNLKNLSDTAITLYRNSDYAFTGVILFDQILMDALSIGQGDDLQLIYKSGDEDIIQNLKADYNVIPIIELGFDDSEKVNNNVFYFYPNPVKSSLRIKTDSEIQKIGIYTIKGALIETYNGHQESLELGHLDAGLYFVKVHTEDNLFIGRIIKME